MNSNEWTSHIQKYNDWLIQLLESNPISFNTENLQEILPEQMGIYCISEKKNDVLEIIYVGRSKNLQKRIYRNHLKGSRKNSTLRRKLDKFGKYADEDSISNYLCKQCVTQFIVFDDKDKLERNFFEHFAIAVLRPKFND
jgi:hypothetical protein